MQDQTPGIHERFLQRRRQERPSGGLFFAIKNNKQEEVNMNRIEKIAASMMVILFLSGSLFIQPLPAAGEKFVEEFKAVVSKDTIKVGESAIIILSSGGQLDVAASKDVPFDWKAYVTVTQIDKMKFSVKGLAPGKAVITFKNGDKEAMVKVTVVVGGLN
jgi:hypothetical protein